ncbi:hypothetical protein GSI_08658 [Ganoderma sinense ZZ0214-1]|uniref:Uncharacterized protein n=1 Tax=Ganoderma sinense ZZ0214-1 TaxID=1077348 RepID=A0A2G8S4A9_9APHY|nr:hypothetical protein GSI_08658 [Ganoderma sinense ZZ0214-1]
MTLPFYRPLSQRPTLRQCDSVIPVLSDTQAPPLLAKRRMFIEKSQALLASGEEMLSDDDASKSSRDNPHHHPNLGSWATIHEPVFAYATTALEGFLPVNPEVRALDENLEVIDGKAFDIRICAYDLCEAVQHVKHTPDSTHMEALKGLLRDLFDDPDLQVNVKQVREDGGRVSTELEIIGECHTAHGLPAPYIMGKEKLIPNRRFTAAYEGEGFGAYKRAVVGPKYAAVREMTCCPCLIIDMHGFCMHFYAAYFTDDVYRTHLCDIPLPVNPAWSDAAPGEYSNAFKFQVIRKTARELRKSYARVHTGSALPDAPHLYPQPAHFAASPLPGPLTLVDRVPVSPLALPPARFLVRPPLLFTGVLQTMDGGQKPVHVKFTTDRDYGVAAHRLLAKYELEPEPSDADEDEDTRERTPWPLAPAFLHRLLFPGTYTRMVLMETLGGDTLEHLLASNSGAAVSEADLADIRTAVAVLHRHGFVHGDIRASNVLVQRQDAEEGGRGRTGGPLQSRARAFLLDFDWAGRAGKAKYPVSLDERLEWPRPARELRGRYITKRDDLFMLGKMLALVREREERASGGADHDGLGKQKGIAADEYDDGYDDEGDEDDQETETTSAMLSAKPDDGGEDDDPWSAILTREKVVDFGRAHGAVYPVDINPGIKWPRPAEELRCQPITMAHDNFMFEELLKELEFESAGLGEDEDEDEDEMMT